MSADFVASEPLNEAHSFKNGRLAVYWGVVATGSILILLATGQAAVGVASAVIGLFAAQAAAANLIGVIVRHDHVSVPRPLLPIVPVLSLWRTRIPLAHLRDATTIGRFMGLEAVGLGTMDGAVPALFVDRQQKLDFFKALQAEKADVKIYRAF